MSHEDVVLLIKCINDNAQAIGLCIIVSAIMRAFLNK